MTRRRCRRAAVILLTLGLASALAAQPVPSPGVPDYHIHWTLDADASGEYDPNPGDSVLIARHVAVHVTGDADVDVDSPTGGQRADPIFVNGTWADFETVTATYICLFPPNPGQQMTVSTLDSLWTIAPSASEPQDNTLTIAVDTAPDGSLFVRDPLAEPGYVNSILGDNTTTITLTGTDCSGPQGSTNTTSGTGPFPTVTGPGDIPATDASGTSFSRDMDILGYLDSNGQLPFFYHWHVEIFDLHQCSVEVCDGLDNDCDGVVDDGNPGGGLSCDTGLLGVCAAGTTACSGGAIVCNQNVQPSAEVCDLADNDCNGQTDEGNIGPTWYQDLDGDGYGNPSVSTQACNRPTNYVSNHTDCNDSDEAIHPGTPDAICNGVDDNCNGAVDEDYLGHATSCGVGACARTGTSVCVGSQELSGCTPGTPTAETCDAVDNDCNGVVDDGNPGGGFLCNTGLLGICAVGVTQCSNGGLICFQLNAPSAETCDGADNDCDGAIDNGNPGGGLSCNTGLPGVCGPGTTSCSNGAIVCNQNVQPSAEICDNLDNDCDGSVDETCGPPPTVMLTALSPAKVWVGLKNGGDGIRLDLMVRVSLNGNPIGSGHLDSVAGGSSGFSGANLNEIALTLPSPVPVSSGSALGIEVFVRNACSGSGKNSGTARLWYNGQPIDTGRTRDAGSRFDATIGTSNSNYFLRENSALSATAGSSQLSIDKTVKKKCALFEPFGTWSVALP